jgi:hypothetical protein
MQLICEKNQALTLRRRADTIVSLSLFDNPHLPSVALRAENPLFQAIPSSILFKSRFFMVSLVTCTTPKASNIKALLATFSK